MSKSQAPTNITASRIQPSPQWPSAAIGRAIELEFGEFTVHLMYVDKTLVNVSLWKNGTDEVIGSYPCDLTHQSQSDQLEFEWTNGKVH